MAKPQRYWVATRDCSRELWCLQQMFDLEVATGCAEQLYTDIESVYHMDDHGPTNVNNVMDGRLRRLNMAYGWELTKQTVTTTKCHISFITCPCHTLRNTLSGKQLTLAVGLARKYTDVFFPQTQIFVFGEDGSASAVSPALPTAIRKVLYA